MSLVWVCGDRRLVTTLVGNSAAMNGAIGWRLTSCTQDSQAPLHVLIYHHPTLVMSDEEDDYLSDKFLVEAVSSSAPKTYVDQRKETLRRNARKNEDNRKKSRREREREAREEALNRSLFERAQEEAKESGQQNKALAMMMKMGFKPGQALGKDESDGQHTAASASGSRSRSAGDAYEDEDGEEKAQPPSPPRVDEREVEPGRAGIGARPAHDAVEAAARDSAAHRKVPLALNEWQGVYPLGRTSTTVVFIRPY